MVENKKKAKDLEIAEEKSEGVEMGEKKLKGKNMDKDYWIWYFFMTPTLEVE